MFKGGICAYLAMPEPKPIQESDGRIAWYFVSGLLLLAGGIYAEAALHPLVPVGYVPALLIIPIGLAVGIAVFELYFPRWGSPLYMLLAFLIVYQQFKSDTSALPVLAYAGVFQLARGCLRIWARLAE